MAYQDIIYTKEQGIATITMNRPDKMNAFSPEMSESILRVIEDVSVDIEARVLVITGVGKAFCAGADAKKMATQEPSRTQSIEEATGLTEVHRQLPIRLQELDKPVIASINGVAAGGGMDLACACDIRIASDRAKFSAVFVRRGLVPGLGGAYFLPRLVGLEKALKIMWTGDLVDAQEAERIGLVSMVVPHEELESATREFAEKLAKGPPLAIQSAKRMTYDGLKTDLKTHIKSIAPIVAKLWKTEDCLEATRAFVEKREPVFKGR